MSLAGEHKFFARAAAVVASLASVLAVSAAPAMAQQAAIGNDDIGGVVTGPNGPEAGIWMIAKMRDLPTRFAKMIVTDD